MSIKKIIIVAIAIVLTIIILFALIKKSAFLNQLFFKKTANEPITNPAGLIKELNGLNHYEKAYTNPFE